MSERDPNAAGGRPDGAGPASPDRHDDTSPGGRPPETDGSSGAGASKLGAGSSSPSGYGYPRHGGDTPEATQAVRLPASPPPPAADAGSSTTQFPTYGSPAATAQYPPAEQPAGSYPASQYPASEYPGSYPGSPSGPADGQQAGFPDENRQAAPVAAPKPVRRPDVVAGLLLILAGIAAAVSLLLRWFPDDDDKGWDFVRTAVEALGDDVGGFLDGGSWQPLAIVLGGGALFVLGLLVLVPARRHLLLGVVALVIAERAAEAVAIVLNDLDWDLGRIELGFWFAIAVAVLGLLGALKAIFTGPKYRT